jgi:hypothetical protein
MNDRERLVQWMQENGYDTRRLALVTGDTRTNIHWMIKPDEPREINQAFKWRFREAFGNDEADRVFCPGKIARSVADSELA